MPTFYKELEFDGTNDYVDTGNANETDKLSVSVIIKVGSHGQPDVFASKYSTGGANDRSWLISVSNVGGSPNKVRWIISEDGTYGAGKTKHWESTADLLTTGRHQIGFSFDGGTLVPTFDGVEVTSLTKTIDDAITSIHSSSVTVKLGAYVSTSPTTIQGALQGSLCNMIMTKTAIMSIADFARHWGSGTPADPTTMGFDSATLDHSWLWNGTITYPDVPDNTGALDGTMQNMDSGDIVDTPWPVTTNCLYVPDGYVVVPDSAFYPGQYIREGEDDPRDGSDSTTKGLVDVACNNNYAHKRMVKTYVRQDLQSFSDIDKVVVTTGAASIHVFSWRIDHLLADQGFRIRYTAKTADANAVKMEFKLYDFATHTDTMKQEDTWSNATYAERTVDFDATTFAAYIAAAGYAGPHFLEVWVAEEDVGGVAHLKSILAESVDDGANEITSGKRDNDFYPQCWEAYANNSAWSVDQVNTLGANIQSIREDKTSTHCNFCDDLQDLANPAFESQVAQTGWQTVVRFPIDYQPGVSVVAFAIAGFYVDASDRFRIYTQEELAQTGIASITERQFSGLVGAFDITTAADWVVATMPVRETVDKKGDDIVTLEFKGTVSRGITLVALEVVEVV